MYYTDIGHNGNDTAYVLPRDADDILIANSNEYDVHDDLFDRNVLSRADFSGRIDHSTKTISIAAGGPSDKRRNYLASILSTYYPDYSIYAFISDYKYPVRISCSQ
jgi:hypothetical protein